MKSWNTHTETGCKGCILNHTNWFSIFVCLDSGSQSRVYICISLEPEEAEEGWKALGGESGNVKKQLGVGGVGVSGELRLFGLWEHESHQSSSQQQNRHQQYRYSTVSVHQLSKDNIGHDRRHSAHSGEEAESRGPEKKDVETVQTDPPESMSYR